MSYLGDRALGATVDLKFTTAVNGFPTALAGSPAISVYKSGTTTPITAGVTYTSSYNSTAGLNDVSIVASAGNGFAAGFDYQVVITTGTLGGVSMVGVVVGEFSVNLANIAMINGSASAATTLEKMIDTVPTGTVTTGASTTSVPVSALTIKGVAASGVDANQYANRTMYFAGDTATAGLQGASALISANTASNTPTFTVAALPATPASGDVFTVS